MRSLTRAQVDRQVAAIDGLQKEIATIYQEERLTSIAGPDMEFMINGRQVLVWFFDVVRKGQLKYSDRNFHQAFDDIVFCADEVMHFTAQLFLYRPYLNNPIREGYQFAGKMLYPNHQNLAAKRYGMYTHILFEKLYNFWDRIGDLIAVYFPDDYEGKNVYFGRVIDKMPVEFHSDSYKWLKQFKDTEYDVIVSKRTNIVHYINNDTTFKHQHVNASHDKALMEKLIAERDALPDYFKKQLDLIQSGFEKTLTLLSEITASKLSDVN